MLWEDKYCAVPPEPGHLLALNNMEVYWAVLKEMGLPWGTCLTSHSYILHWNFNNKKFKKKTPLSLFVFWRSLDFYATCLKNATRDDQSMRSAQALVPEAYSIIQRQCSKKSELTWNTYASPKVLVPTEADSEKTVKTGGFWRGFVICLLDFGPLTPGLLSVLNNFLLCVLFHSLAYSCPAYDVKACDILFSSVTLTC